MKHTLIITKYLCTVQHYSSAIEVILKSDAEL